MTAAAEAATPFHRRVGGVGYEADGDEVAVGDAEVVVVVVVGVGVRERRRQGNPAAISHHSDAPAAQQFLLNLQVGKMMRLLMPFLL